MYIYVTKNSSPAQGGVEVSVKKMMYRGREAAWEEESGFGAGGAEEAVRSGELLAESGVVALELTVFLFEAGAPGAGFGCTTLKVG